MKKILFSLVALVCSMSMNAQVMIVMKGNTQVAIYTAAQADNVLLCKEALASVTFEIGDPHTGETDFTGFESEKITASNDDVTITLALNGGEWNIMGDFIMATRMTATVTPKATGVIVTGIKITDLDHKSMTETGAGPWNFTLNAKNYLEIYDGIRKIHGITSVTVEYTKIS